MQIKSIRDVMIFASTLTVLVTIAAVILSGFFFARYFDDILNIKYYDGIFALTIIIAVPIAFTVCAVIGNMLRKQAILSEKLQKLVDRDRLTDAATRDYFFARLEDRAVEGVSLMVDIDHFKSVNDTHGHLVGDQVIRTVVDLIKGQVRSQDIVCRFGGEEFTVFLFNADAAKGLEVAERIRKVIAQKSHTLTQAELRVTVSIGGSLKTQLSDVNEAIKNADRALYRAKAQGRNRTVFANVESQIEVSQAS